MTCEEFQSELALYVGHQLSPEEEAAIAAHVHSCASCQQALEEERQFALAVHNASIPFRRASESVRHNLSAALPGPGFNTIRASRRHLMPLLAGAAALACLVIAQVLFRHPGNQEIDAIASWAIGTYPLIDQTHALRGDAATVRAWFKDHHHVEISPPAKVDYGDLVGCKMTELGKDPAPLLKFEGRETSAVFLLPTRYAAEINGAPSADITREGFRIVMWTEQGNPYLRISKLL
ncbi:MAG TPA: zf-HC2 domain-containing protein [Bacteroidota bacterium]|nr:zf-HC2 domain-containing protein [Bacteroidota bacterium]